MKKENRDNDKIQLKCPNCKQIYSADNEMSNTKQVCPDCGFNGFIGNINYNSNINNEPKFGKGKIAEYNMRLTQEERIEAARKAGIESGKKRHDANVKEAYLRAMKSDLPIDDELRAELERLGLPTSELQAMAYSNVRAGRNNPKAAELSVKVVGQMPSERMSVEIHDSQKSPEELRAFFGVGLEDENNSEEDEV